MPISILEAMSVGLPIIATNVTGNKDALEHGISGYLYDLGDINHAKDYILSLIKNKYKEEKKCQFSLKVDKELIFYKYYD